MSWCSVACHLSLSPVTSPNRVIPTVIFLRVEAPESCLRVRGVIAAGGLYVRVQGSKDGLVLQTTCSYSTNSSKMGECKRERVSSTCGITYVDLELCVHTIGTKYCIPVCDTRQGSVVEPCVCYCCCCFSLYRTWYVVSGTRYVPGTIYLTSSSGIHRLKEGGSAYLMQTRRTKRACHSSVPLKSVICVVQHSVLSTPLGLHAAYSFLPRHLNRYVPLPDI